MKTLFESLIGKHNINNIVLGLKKGDDLQEWDIVIVGVECHTGESNNIVKYGVYHKDVNPYPNGAIVYYNARLGWDDMKDNYQWTYNNAYTHYILKVYRPYPGKESTINPKRQENIDIKDLENSKDYYCIYSDLILLKKFKLK